LSGEAGALCATPSDRVARESTRNKAIPDLFAIGNGINHVVGWRTGETGCLSRTGSALFAA
jgi:hypothetical protein